MTEEITMAHNKNIDALYEYCDKKNIDENFEFSVFSLDSELIEKDDKIAQLENNQKSYLLTIRSLNEKNKKHAEEIDKFIDREEKNIADQKAEMILREQLTVIFNKASKNDKFEYTENLLKTWCDKIKKERNTKFIRPFRKYVERARMYAYRLYFTELNKLNEHERELRKLTEKYIDINIKCHINIVKYSDTLEDVKSLNYQYYDILDKMLKFYDREKY